MGSVMVSLPVTGFFFFSFSFFSLTLYLSVCCFSVCVVYCASVYVTLKLLNFQLRTWLKPKNSHGVYRKSHTRMKVFCLTERPPLTRTILSNTSSKHSLFSNTHTHTHSFWNIHEISCHHIFSGSFLVPFFFFSFLFNKIWLLVGICGIAYIVCVRALLFFCCCFVSSLSQCVLSRFFVSGIPELLMFCLQIVPNYINWIKLM